MKIESRESLLNVPIYQVVLALGSNHEALANLEQARQALEQLASAWVWSTPYENADYTATPDRPKPNYVNQCGSLMVSVKKFTLNEIIRLTKNIEQRIAQANPLNPTTDYRQVSIDIDVLMVSVKPHYDTDDKNVRVGDKDDEIQTDDYQMMVISERMPLKQHERLGLKELSLKQLDLDVLDLNKLRIN